MSSVIWKYRKRKNCRIEGFSTFLKGTFWRKGLASWRKRSKTFSFFISFAPKNLSVIRDSRSGALQEKVTFPTQFFVKCTLRRAVDPPRYRQPLRRHVQTTGDSQNTSVWSHVSSITTAELYVLPPRRDASHRLRYTPGRCRNHMRSAMSCKAHPTNIPSSRTGWKSPRKSPKPMNPTITTMPQS